MNITYHQVNLGFVNAYVLIRGNEVAIVDTGVANSEAAIANVMNAAGANWSNVRHVILTHHHPDHAGSIQAVLDAATGATAYAGAPDIPNIKTTARLQTLADGQELFGLQMIATPGHTPGHFSVYDPAGLTLITGDALNNGGALSGPNPQFTPDMATAIQSAKKLGTFNYERAFFMHGNTIDKGASAAIAAMAAGLK